MEGRTLSVIGMACDGCEATVENALGALDGVTRVDADNEADTVDVVAGADVSDDELATAVTDAGYEIAE